MNKFLLYSGRRTRIRIFLFSFFIVSNLIAQTWQAVGLSGQIIENFGINSNAAGGMNLFAGTCTGGVFVSTNNGTSWTALNSGLPTGSSNQSLVTSFAFIPTETGDTNIFAGTWEGVYLSTNNGSSWTSVSSGLTNSHVQSFALLPNGSGGTNIFAGTWGGLFLSTNNGSSWKAVNTVLTNTFVSSLLVNGTNLFAGTDTNGVFLSTDSGTNWTAVGSGLPMSLENSTLVSSLIACPNGIGGTNLFAGTERDGIFISTNNGVSWTYSGLANIKIFKLTFSPNGAGGINLFAGTESGVYLSTNNGTNWTSINTGFPSLTAVSAIALSGTNLFAGTGSGVYITSIANLISTSDITNPATSVTSTSATLNGTINPNGLSTTVQFDYGTTTSYGNSVTASQSPVTGSSNVSVTANLSGLTSNTLYHYRVEATNTTGTTYGPDSTFTTLPNSIVLTTLSASSITQTTATLNGTVNPNGTSTSVDFQYSSNSGDGDWGYSHNPVMGTATVQVSQVITGLTPNTLYSFFIEASNNNGKNFSHGTESTFTTLNVQSPTVTTLSATIIGSTSSTLNGTVNANGASSTVQFDYGTTTSYGNTVTASQSPVTGSSNINVSANLTGLTPNTLYHFRCRATNSAGTNYGADSTFTTASSTLLWQQASPSYATVQAFAIGPNGTGGTNLYAGVVYGVLRSTNNGLSWTQVNNGLADTAIVVSLAVSPNNVTGADVFAGTASNGVYLSTNNGSSWTQVNNGLTNKKVRSLLAAGTSLFALTYETTGSVFLSTNNGSSWTLVNNGLTNYDVNSFTECPDTTGALNFYAAAWGGAFRSTNNGSSWTPAGLSNLGVISIAGSSNEEGGINLFAGTNGNGVYFSSDNGSSWTQVNNGITDLFISAIAVSPNGSGGSNLFAGTFSGVFLSTNNGSNWTLVNNGLTNTFVGTLVVSGTTLIAGNNGGIFYASLANLTAIKEITNSATNITTTTATLNGIVYPNGLNTIVQFDYGTNTGYGNTITASQSPVTGSSNVSVSANLTGLAANTLYHFRVKATNSNGITYGPDSTFSTIKRGDIDGNTSNGPDAYSASLVLKYLAGLDTLNAQQLADAEVDGNTGLTANDAYWILYATAYGSFPDGSVPKAEGPSTGTISAGQLCSQENSNLVTIPIILQKSHGIHACFIELNINKSFADVENVAANIPRDWLMVHNYVNGVLKIAMAGVTPLTDGNLAMISLNLKDKNAGFSINGSAKLNANLKQAINNFTVQAVPNQFGLSQNYPNPFNPSTKIKYQLARDSHVSLTVYDILGQKVRTLINELQQAGYYNITWDGNNDAGNKASSGIYIYRLQSGNFIKTLKMNLLK
jgi:phosphodiesterase/alkaline phosphatase D-like protein